MSMEIRRTVFLTLGLPEIYKFKFRCAGSHILVEPLGFVKVLYAVFFRNAIQIKIDPTRLSKEHAGAEYNADDKTLYFADYRYGLWPAERAGIIHECVHAMQHIRKHQHTYFQEEAAAYIAEALYLRYNSGQTAREYYGPSADPITLEADEIAGKIMGNMDALVDLPDQVDLIRAIRGNKAYAKIKGDPAVRNANGVYC